MAELPFLLNNSMETRPKSHLQSVSGGQVKWSLPCNVNSGESAASIQFLEEAKRSKAMKNKDYTAIDMETATLLDNDHLAQSYEDQQQQPIEMNTLGGPKYTSKATLQISRANVDDAITMRDLDSLEAKRTLDYNTLKAKVINSRYQVITPIASSTATYGTMRTSTEEKRSLDENGNALGHPTQSKLKKKKVQSDRNVNVMLAESIQGYKGKEDVEDLLNYIEGIDGNLAAAGKSRSLPKSKQLHKQHTTEEGGSKGGSKRQKKGGKDSTGAGGDTGSRTELKKSNSLSEISGMKLDSEFAGSIASSTTNSEWSSSVKGDEQEQKVVVMRVKKEPADRPRERRSWGNVELSSFQPIYNTSSLENMETSADNWVVTRPKKKSKKRRNSVSSAGGRLRPDLSRSNTGPPGSLDGHNNHRTHSPDLRTVISVGGSNKITRSMPHSEKSNDSSSDVDSVHSLPIDGPISYADIAKNIEKKKPSPEKQSSSERPLASSQTSSNAKEKSPQPPSKPQYNTTEPSEPPRTPNVNEKSSLTSIVTLNAIVPPQNRVPDVNSIKSFPAIITDNKNVPLDVHNIRSFPAITGSLSKTVQTAVNSNNSHVITATMTSDKAVQSTITSYEDRTPATNIKSGVSCAAVGVAGVVNPSRVVSAQANTKKQSSPSPISEKTNKGAKDGNKGVVAPQRGSSEGVAMPGTRQDGQKEQSVSSEIKTELSFIQQANETNQIVATAYCQKLPPDIPDVATIEKLQFMSMSPPPMNMSPQPITVQNQQAVNSQSPPSGQQGQLQQSSRNQKRNKNREQQQQQKEKQQKASGGQQHDSDHRQPSPPKSSDTSYCDSSKNDELTCSSHLINGVLEDPSLPEPPASPPAVVILSGTASKEVPQDLVFGFDINEQLLQEDEEAALAAAGGEEPVQDTGGGEEDKDYVARYLTPPKESALSAHSLEKIVHYIGSAWEQIISSQKVQYYSDDL